MTDRPDPGSTPETGTEESDPNADSTEGLAGGMGVSSERPGPVRGQAEDATYGAAPTHLDDGAGHSEGDEPPPEQSASSPEPEVHPDPVEPKPFDPDRNPRHGT